MKTLEPKELASHTTVINALSGLVPLLILEYLNNHNDIPTIEEVHGAIKQTIEAIPLEHVKAFLRRLEQAEIIELTGATFAEPDANRVMISVGMPDLAQKMIVEIWPDWYKDESVEAA